ncbi:MAG TPA: XdhC family protein [Candidatus Dormibacteraeota bacterium]
MSDSKVETELARRLEAGEEAVLATVIRTDGEPPSRAGAKILLDRDRALAGTLGCSEFDTAAAGDAAGLLESGAPSLRTYRHDLGSIEVYLEAYPAAPTLLVAADTPVARALVRWAPELGFRVRALPEGEPAPTDLGRDLYVVHTNHDAPDLPELLEAVLSRDPPARYVGLMGSRRHTGHHLDALARRGVPAEQLERIQTPVGIDIGARTPEEIALSMLAGLVAIRRGARLRWLDASHSV